MRSVSGKVRSIRLEMERVETWPRRSGEVTEINTYL